jgi:hypothetical protein
MTGLARIDYVEGALIALLKANLPAAYGAPVDIQPIGDKDFDENGRLVLQPPSVRVLFVDAGFSNLRDNLRLTYEAATSFEIWCLQSSRRSLADERVQTLGLVAPVINQLVGARLSLEDGSRTCPATLKRIYLIRQEELPADQVFSIVISFEGPAQFDGPNANFGGNT